MQISGESKSESENQSENNIYVRREFGYSVFQRTFTLPENVDTSTIAAQYKDGILNIEIPKHEVKNFTQTIEVK